MHSPEKKEGKKTTQKVATQFPGRIRNKLIIMFLIPSVLFVAVFGWYYYHLAQTSLEEEMGLRLQTLAGSAVESISGESAVNFSPGDETGRAYQNSKSRLERLMPLGDAERIYVFDKNRQSLLDTKSETLIGTQYFQLDADRFEIDQVFSKGVTASSMAFTGEDGKLYKTGYAPIFINGEVRAVLGVNAGVRFFGTLASIRHNLFMFVLAWVIGVILVSLFVAKGIEQPIGKLVNAARLIGTGELDTKIVPTTKDEIGFLTYTLNEMRESIVERDRYLQMLQRGIAHEVRNPLGGMELFCDILSDELSGDETKLAYVAKIRREISALDKVVNDFLDFTKEVVPDIREVNLENFLNEILIHYSFQPDTNKVEIQLNLDPDAETVRLDPELIRRSLFNLINNGIQAMPKGGKLLISTTVVNGNLEIIILDTGYGIKENEIESLFTPFFTTKDKGTGLGLPLTKKIVEIHGGKIEIESEQGHGTKVTLSLPLD